VVDLTSQIVTDYDTTVSKGRYNVQNLAEWLLLIHLLPAKPDYLRVKIWRRLQGLGAVAIKNSVYVLPAGERSREDLQWLQKEIEALGGEASICEARFVDGVSDAQIRELFNAARDADYAQLIEQLREPSTGAPADESTIDEPRQRLRKARKRFEQIVALDYFGASGRGACAVLLAEREAALRPQPIAARAASAHGYRSRTWVTRPDVGIDRIASAWLIQRHIDAEARFVFAAEQDPPVDGQLRFDTTQGEFTHVADRCTFEVLLDRFGLDDPALAMIGRIVHDLDFKDGKFGEDEAPGVARLIDGLRRMQPDDVARISAAGAVFDALLASFQPPLS